MGCYYFYIGIKKGNSNRTRIGIGWQREYEIISLFFTVRIKDSNKQTKYQTVINYINQYSIILYNQLKIVIYIYI